MNEFPPLFEPTRFSLPSGGYTQDFAQAAKRPRLTWDAAAVASILSHKFPLGDRTLFQEITRRTWMDGYDIPPHGKRLASPRSIARKFMELLVDEARAAVSGKKRVFILLSGGLDSRMIAGVLKILMDNGELPVVPHAITWGLPRCRDVVYGRRIAEDLGFDWTYVPLDSSTLEHNIVDEAIRIGGLNPPSHLHGMSYFRNFTKDDLVLAGSWGDMVGRAEFSSNHISELKPIRVSNRLGLMTDKAFEAGLQGCRQDLEALHRRAGTTDPIVLRELEQHNFYTRGMLGNVMSIIDQTATLHQMFTAGSVYSFLWSHHPVVRNDAVYVHLMNFLGHDLISYPWARTNRALRGQTRGADETLDRRYHDYFGWLRADILPRYRDEMSSGWFEATGLFRPGAVAGLTRLIETQIPDPYAAIYPNESWMWLLSLKRIVERLPVPVEPFAAPDTALWSLPPVSAVSRLRRALHNPFFKKVRSQLRRWATLLKYRAQRS